jgi:DNA excision repair protein ERCC-4
MVYANSCEEHKYLAGIRKEKDAFQRLIKERGVSQLRKFVIDNSDDQPLQSMMITLVEDRREQTANDAIIKTISTRVAGGRREIKTEPSRVSRMLATEFVSVL